MTDTRRLSASPGITNDLNQGSYTCNVTVTGLDQEIALLHLTGRCLPAPFQFFSCGAPHGLLAWLLTHFSLSQSRSVIIPPFVPLSGLTW